MTDPHFTTDDVTLCICSNLRRVNRKVTQLYDNALRPVDLTAAQFNILATLKHRPDLPLTDLSVALGVDRTTLSRNLKPLGRRGLIEAGTRDDERIRTTSLTTQGLAKFEESYPLWHATQDSLARKLGAANANALLTMLGDVLSEVESKTD